MCRNKVKKLGVLTSGGDAPCRNQGDSVYRKPYRDRMCQNVAKCLPLSHAMSRTLLAWEARYFIVSSDCSVFPSLDIALLYHRNSFVSLCTANAKSGARGSRSVRER